MFAIPARSFRPRHAIETTAIALICAAGITIFGGVSVAQQSTPADAPATEKAPVAAKAPGAKTAEPEPRKIHRVELNDGQVIRGTLVDQNADHIVLELATGGRMTLPRKSIRRLSVDKHAKVDASGEMRFADPNRTRYLYGPSAFTLKKGECYFSQKQLFFSAVACGVHDNVTLLAGAVVPAWFMGEDGLNVIVAAKAGLPVADKFRIAGGFETIFVPQAGAFGFLFANATYGTRDAHITLAAGKPVVLRKGEFDPGAMIATISGNYRISRSVALITENWLINPTADLTLIDALGVRLMGEQHAVDLGLIFIPTENLDIPIPWLDYTFNF